MYYMYFVQQVDTGLLDTRPTQINTSVIFLQD